MNKKLKTSIKTIIFMLICSAVCVGGVSTAFIATKKRIRLNEEMVKYKAVLSASDITIPDSPEKVQELYKEKVEEIKNKEGEIVYFKIKNGSYAVKCSGIGLWGPIRGIIGLDPSLKKIEGIAFTYQNETPGLGARIEEKWFKEQFRGKIIPLKIVTDGEKPGENEFDAITGATITSTAVKKMVNKTYEKAGEIIK
jgi:Na+-transporting NADH:ubiquinone oxidoreductase subunit C